MHNIFVALPILLAIYSAIICAKQYALDRRKHHKHVLLLGVFNSVLLIIAQTSWYVTYVVNGDLLATWFADELWNVFNITTMVAYILLARGGAKDVGKPTT